MKKEYLYGPAEKRGKMNQKKRKKKKTGKLKWKIVVGEFQCGVFQRKWCPIWRPGRNKIRCKNIILPTK